jgi:hypothetical protein
VSADRLAIVELALVFGAVLAFGFWELWSLRRDRKRAEREAAASRGDDPSGETREPSA